MLSKLAKIANKLDGLGLVKEADILDRFIGKIAVGQTSTTIGSDENLVIPGEQFESGQKIKDVYNVTPATKITPAGINEGNVRSSAPKTWEEYLAVSPNGKSVMDEWKLYSSRSGDSPDFSAFAKWWRAQKKAGRIGMGGVAETVAKLSRDSALAFHASGPSSFDSYKGSGAQAMRGEISSPIGGDDMAGTGIPAAGDLRNVVKVDYDQNNLEDMFRNSR